MPGGVTCMHPPANDRVNLELLLPEIITVADEASRIILEVYDDPHFTVSFKDDRSPLTLADARSNEHITERLGRLTPVIPVISEESATPPWETRRSWKRLWLLDPLDGTKEFVSRNGEFTVNIALVENGRPILGVMAAPALKILYAAAQGLGAMKRDEQHRTAGIHVSSFHDGLVVAASRSHDRDKMADLLNEWKPREVIYRGSALKMGLVAEGAAHLYPRLGPTMEWDTAAAHCILNEAGGSVTAWDGSELTYNKPDLHNPGFLAFGHPRYPVKA